MLAQNHSTTEPQAPGQLSDQYYLDNFTYLIEFVQQHYQQLLTADESQVCEDFKQLSDDGRKLYVRLVLRIPDLLRVSKLHYPEIDHIDSTIVELANALFVTHQPEPTIEQFQQLFSLSELKSAGIPNGNTQTVDTSQWNSPDLFGQSPLTRILELDSIIEIHHKALIKKFRLLFFGNLHQNFSDFVLRDLGLKRYESYNIDSKTLHFKTRTQLQAHLNYYECADLFDEACELGCESLIELYQKMPGAVDGDRALSRRVNRLANSIARQLEREDALTDAAAIYCQNQHPPARERAIRIKAKTENTNEALAMCREIIDAPADTDELDFAMSFGQRLAKKTGDQFPQPDLYSPPDINLQLKPQNLNVEFSVALHLAKSGKCYYLENNLLSGVFGLAFWDIVFAPINGAFYHPFQSKPVDLYEPDFTHLRAQQIQNRLRAVAAGDLHYYAFKHLFEKRGISNPFVNWQLLRSHILSLAIERIPAKDWEAIFRLILSDIRNYRSGQPDLVYFPDNINDGSYQLLEVKAPGDRLQKNQLRWMRFFKQQNINHAVVHVEWQDVLPDECSVESSRSLPSYA